MITLPIRYVKGDIPQEEIDYNPTDIDMKEKNITIDNQNVKLDIIDTAGQDEYANIRQQQYAGSDVVVFLYRNLFIAEVTNVVPWHATCIFKILCLSR